MIYELIYSQRRRTGVSSYYVFALPIYRITNTPITKLLYPLELNASKALLGHCVEEQSQ